MDEEVITCALSQLKVSEELSKAVLELFPETHLVQTLRDQALSTAEYRTNLNRERVRRTLTEKSSLVPMCLCVVTTRAIEKFILIGNSDIGPVDFGLVQSSRVAFDGTQLAAIASHQASERFILSGKE